jgi:hypothetical protein
MWGQSRGGWQQEAAILRRHIVMVVVFMNSSGNRINLPFSLYQNDVMYTL